MNNAQEVGKSPIDGRELVLEFTGKPPELTKIEFRYSKGFDSVPLGREKPGLQWNSLAKAFCTCMLKYLRSDPDGDKAVPQKNGESIRVFEFVGPPRNSYVASLGNAIVDEGRWIHAALIKKKGVNRMSAVREIFVGGINLAGTNTKLERTIFVHVDALPRHCIRVIHRDSPTDAGGRIRGKQLGDLLAAIPVDGKFKKVGRPLRLRLAKGSAEVSVGHFPKMPDQILGREEWLQKLDTAWKDPNIRVFTLWAWGGRGKTAVADTWLKSMEARKYDGAEYVLGWSFNSQDLRESGSGDKFMDFALRFFGDNIPSEGERGERGVRLARLIKKHKSLLILDGIDSLQYPPSPHSGRLTDPALATLLVELASDECRGLCLVTTRFPVTELLGCRKESSICVELNPLTGASGRQLLRANGVKGEDSELEQVANFFQGDALTLTLLASYLRTAWQGNIHKWKTVKLLKELDSHGGHAKSMMAAYEEWFKDKPEMSVLRIVGLLDRPADQAVLSSLRSESNIPGLSNELRALSEGRWTQAIQSLRDKHLVYADDQKHHVALDAHPLVREYFEEQMRDRFPELWLTGNKFLSNYYGGLVSWLPSSLQELECLFSAVIHGCKANLHQHVLDEIFVPRIMRGKQRYASENLNAVGGVASVLGCFFEEGNWSIPVKQLERKSQLYVLKEAARSLTEINGYAATEVEQCYSKGLALCAAKDAASRIELLLGLTRCTRVRGKLLKSGQMANQLLTLTRGRVELACAARRAVSTNCYYTGDFVGCQRNAKLGIIKYRTRGAALANARLDVNEPSISCLGYLGLSAWFLGKPDKSLTKAREALRLAKALGHSHTVAISLLIKAMVHQFRGELGETDVAATELERFCREKGFLLWRLSGQILRAWATSQSARPTPLTSIHQLVTMWKDNHAELFLPYWYGLVADECVFQDEIGLGLEAVNSGLEYANDNSEHWWDSELYRTHGLLFAKAKRPEDAKRSFEKAIVIARSQKSPMLELRSLISITKHCSDLVGHSLQPELRRCYNTFTEGMETSDLTEAKRLLEANRNQS